MTTKIIACTCIHDYQDRLYGPGRRVHNYARAANNKAGGYRCTRCKAVKAASAYDKKDEALTEKKKKKKGK